MFCAAHLKHARGLQNWLKQAQSAINIKKHRMSQRQIDQRACVETEAHRSLKHDILTSLASDINDPSNYIFCTTLVSLDFHQALISREISRRANENYKEIWWAIKRRAEHCWNLDVMCSTLQQTRRMEHHSFFIVNVFSRSKRWTENAAISIFLWTRCAIWCLSRSPDVQHDVTRMRCLQSQLQTCYKTPYVLDWISSAVPKQGFVFIVSFIVSQLTSHRNYDYLHWSSLDQSKTMRTHFHDD